MFLLEIAVGICTYLVAKSIWHFVVLRASTNADTKAKLLFRLVDTMAVCLVVLFFLILSGAVLFGGMAIIDAVRK